MNARDLHVDIEPGLIEQNSREVRSKRAKTFTTWFVPVGDETRKIVVDWVAFLRQEKRFGSEDPLFPKTEAASVGRPCWIRRIAAQRSV